MARPVKGKTLGALAGKLGLIRREVQQVMRALAREIQRREKELAALKAEFAQASDLLRGKTPPPPPAARRRSRRSRPLDWGRVLDSLPAKFGLETLVKHPVAGKRPKAHLYAIVSRWKKDGKLAAAAGGGYRKVAARPAPKQASKTPRPKPPAPKSAEGGAASQA